MNAAPKSTRPVRPWRGVSATDRTSERRERLLEAGLECFATRGYANSSVREVCREAGLTERYFYESFAGREALLKALADGIVEDFLLAVAPILPLLESDLPRAAHEGAAAFVASLADDPRRARILLVESVGVSPSAEDHRRTVFAHLVGFLREAAALSFGDWVRQSAEFEVLARAVIGGAQELLVAYVRGELHIERDELVTSLAQLFVSAGPIVAALANKDPFPTKEP